MVYDQKVSYVSETIDTNCDEDVSPTGSWPTGNFLTRLSPVLDKSGSSTTNGVAGSMARFALYDNYLYTVNQSTMQLFNIKNPSDPKIGNQMQMGWGIETIFPYKDKLFIGSNRGCTFTTMSIRKNQYTLSVFQHARVCDPVVVNDNIAYVTLRSGNQCGGFTNQLDVVDITNLTNPSCLRAIRCAIRMAWGRLPESVHLRRRIWTEIIRYAGRDEHRPEPVAAHRRHGCV